MTGSRRRMVLCCLTLLTLAACGGTSPTPTPAPLPTATLSPKLPAFGFQQGMVYASFYRGQLSDPASDATLADVVRPLGANWISLVVTCYQDTVSSVFISCDRDGTPTDGDLSHAIVTAHQLGMKVMLKPHIDLFRETDPTLFRGNIAFGQDESAWQAWFANYTAFITRYAKFAQDRGVEAFVAGTELRDTTARTNDWRGVIRAVRAAYRGQITYAANWDEEAKIQWWDAVDQIGVDAYYPVSQTDQPTVTQLVAAWMPITTHLAALSKQYNRPVILTEIGYQSRNGTSRKPSGVLKETLDLAEQRDCYEAAMKALIGQPWLVGMFWWYATTEPMQGGTADTEYSPIGKPAAEVLRSYYGGAPRG